MKNRRPLYSLFLALALNPVYSVATTLTGVVVDAEKSALIPGASVSVDVLIPDSITLTTLSTSSGVYALADLPAGNQIYVIRCYVSGFAPFYMRYDALGLGDRQVDILMYPEQTVPPGGGGGDSTTVAGIVLHETQAGARNPVGNATVTLTSSIGQTSSLTGVDGRYSIRLPAGRYSLNVAAPECETLTAGGLAVDTVGLTLNVLLKSTPVGVPPDLEAAPASFALGNAYPNPFNPTTVVGYQIPVASSVRLEVFDLLGREVALLVNERKSAGTYSVRFDANGMPSGIYLCRLWASSPSPAAGSAGGFVQTRRIILAR